VELPAAEPVPLPLCANANAFESTSAPANAIVASLMGHLLC
jgi:hypothetical protein